MTHGIAQRAAIGGSSDSHSAMQAQRPIDASAPCSRIEGRQSSRSGSGSAGRELPDRLDEGVELRIVGTLMAEEPLPEPIVLAVQQP